MDVPTLDFSKFSIGSEPERDEFADALIKSFEDHGFVKLVKHGVPENTVRNYLEGVLTISDKTLPPLLIRSLDTDKAIIQHAIGGKKEDHERRRSPPTAGMGCCRY